MCAVHLATGAWHLSRLNEAPVPVLFEEGNGPSSHGDGCGRSRSETELEKSQLSDTKPPDKRRYVCFHTEVTPAIARHSQLVDLIASRDVEACFHVIDIFDGQAAEPELPVRRAGKRANAHDQLWWPLH